jgi:transcription elongation factor GreA
MESDNMTKQNPMEKPVLLTQNEFDKLQSELGYLQSSRREDIIKQLKEAMQSNENRMDQEYQLPKDGETYIEKRIQELESLLARARIINPKVSNGKVDLGSLVLIQREGALPEEVTIVRPEAANVKEGLISEKSRLGRSLLGYHVGDFVNVPSPDGVMTYCILKMKP